MQKLASTWRLMRKPRDWKEFREGAFGKINFITLHKTAYSYINPWSLLVGFNHTFISRSAFIVIVDNTILPSQLNFLKHQSLLYLQGEAPSQNVNSFSGETLPFVVEEKGKRKKLEIWGRLFEAEEWHLLVERWKGLLITSLFTGTCWKMSVFGFKVSTNPLKSYEKFGV